MNRNGFVEVAILVLIFLGVVFSGYIIYKSALSSKLGSNQDLGYSPPEVSQSEAGDYGQQCHSNGTCDYGVCQYGTCVHCGYFGETCCANEWCETGSSCSFGKCKVDTDYIEDCGQVGYALCSGSGVCHSGVYDDRAGICVACGDYGQPCCSGEYYCDYGECTNGLCK